MVRPGDQVSLNQVNMEKAILIGLICSLSLTVKGQIPQPDPDTTAKHFLTVASIANLQEANAGQLAAEKGKRADVRSFGQMMVKDHHQAEQQLLQVAKNSNINLSSAATGGIQSDSNLKNAGDKFDQLYVHAMLTDHRNTIATFQAYATTGKDPAVRAYAQQVLPTLKAHLAAIVAIEKEMLVKLQ